MSTIATTSPQGSTFSGKLLLMAIILGVVTLAIPYYYAQNQEVQNSIREMEKSSGKNGKHANLKARESAEQEYERVKTEYQEWDRKPNKTPQGKDIISKLRKLLEHLRQKKDFTGENHSQKFKGN